MRSGRRSTGCPNHCARCSSFARSKATRTPRSRRCSTSRRMRRKCGCIAPSARFARHLVTHMTERFEDRLRAAAQRAETPEPPADLIDRVVAERAAGQRVILPLDEPVLRRRRWSPFGLVTATIAAALAVMVTQRALYRGTTATAADSITSTGDFFVATAFAEQVARGPALPPLRGLSGAQVRAGRYTYHLQYVDSTGRVTPNGAGMIELTAPDANGVMRIAHTEEL